MESENRKKAVWAYCTWLFDYNRLLPACKARRFSRSFRSFRPCNQSHAVAAHCIEISPDGNEKRSKEIDFEVIFQSCISGNFAKRLHALLVVSGKTQSVYLSTKLVNLYAIYGDISSSRGTFDRVPKKDVYTWNSMVSGYVRNGRFSDAVNCFYEMLMTSEVRPDFYSFPAVLKACGNLVDGTRIHSWVFKLGLECDVFIAASLVHMYCRFGYFGVALSIFNDMSFRDLGSWNAIISGFCQNGNATKALGFLDEMRLEGIKMDSVTVATILPVCAQLDDSLRGVLVHLYVIKSGLEFDVFVANALINMYAKFGKLADAQLVFDQMVLRDLVSWNSIIAAYEQNNDPDSALRFFREMQSNYIQPDLLTLVSLASSVSQSRNHRISTSIHGFVLRRCWIMQDVIIGNAVVDMYAKLGYIDSARKLFEDIPLKDAVSWNTMITGYGQNGLASEAIQVYGSKELRRQHFQVCSEKGHPKGKWLKVFLLLEPRLQVSSSRYPSLALVIG
ncbi:hypothetical protein RJ639_005565 [Escallonia herrerae]|uniref:Pentatricopeptide repeat-containing protein n=1 Tax=Escallonia herrerae TaxID=1293975 RepID=A0AA88VV33_9ASTE|nr:hypothetical protein RJ639_005565 [Escallonia herrerae]